MPYRLNHPDSKQEIEVESDQVNLYLQQGWLTKPTVKPPKADDPAVVPPT